MAGLLEVLVVCPGLARVLLRSRLLSWFSAVASGVSVILAAHFNRLYMLVRQTRGAEIVEDDLPGRLHFGCHHSGCQYRYKKPCL